MSSLCCQETIHAFSHKIFAHFALLFRHLLVWWMGVIKGTQMGPLLVLVCPCLRKIVIVPCKIVSFLCSLDHFLLKNVNDFLFWKLNFKMMHIWKKRTIFYLPLTFLSHQGKMQKILQHISYLHTYTYFAHPIDFFCLTNFAKITNLSCMVSLWCDSWCWFLFVPFWSNQQLTKWWAKFWLEWLLLIFIYTNGKLIVICKPWTMNEGRWRLNSI